MLPWTQSTQFLTSPILLVIMYVGVGQAGERGSSVQLYHLHVWMPTTSQDRTAPSPPGPPIFLL
jgi:hypothetical protein